MNKFNWKKYLDSDWSLLPELCIEPSEALVKKWKGILNFNMNQYRHSTYDPLKFTPGSGVGLGGEIYYGSDYLVSPVKKEDRIEAAYILELVFQCCLFNGASEQKLKMVMRNTRAKMTEEKCDVEK